MLLTGRLLRQLSPAAALAALPLTAGALMTLIAARPSPATVAGAEVLRKVWPLLRGMVWGNIPGPKRGADALLCWCIVRAGPVCGTQQHLHKHQLRPCDS